MRTKITTFLGVLITVFGAISTPDVLALWPAKYSGILVGIGVVLTALGRSFLAPTNTPPSNEVK